ncbi:MAG: aldehyde dehydrogenase family protein, partial [Lachnospiraceae bacterium]|nr:aldehyde dehydrogenase family protein [Lachnospiraceae bacterium]
MKMIINGQAAAASDEKTIDVINPATGQVVDTVPAATEADIEAAVAAAVEGQKIWAQVPVSEKVEIMYRFLDLVEENKEDLAQTLSAETGKPIVEARAEIANIPIAFKAFSEKAKHLYGETIPAGTEAGQDKNIVITRREPIGVIACVIPFNFPCDLFDQKVAPTLLAGNAAIVKPSTDNPLTLCKLTAFLAEAGVTPGAIEIVTGRGSQAGAWLCANPRVHAITLTGSTEVGIETARTAADHLAHVSLELGGNDAFIVLEDGDVDLAVEELIWGRMYNTGQVCCASKRFLIQKNRVEELTEKAIARISKMKQVMPYDES